MLTRTVIAAAAAALSCLNTQGLAGQEPQLRTVLEGHTRFVTAVATTHDGRIVASGGEDGTVRIWDLANGTVRTTLEGRPPLAITQDGSMLAFTRDDGVRLWNVSEASEAGLLTGEARVRGRLRSMSFTPDGAMLATLKGADITLWDVSTGNEMATLSGRTWPIGPDEALRFGASGFTSEGRQLAHLSSQYLPGSGVIVLWDVASGRDRVIASYENERILAIAIAPGGETVATGPLIWHEDDAVKLWDVDTGTVRRLPGHTGRLWDVAFSPDGNTLASASWGDGSVRLWDVATGTPIATLQGLSRFYSVAFSGDGRVLLAAGGDSRGPEDRPGRIMVWDLGPREVRPGESG